MMYSTNHEFGMKLRCQNKRIRKTNDCIIRKREQYAQQLDPQK